MSVRRAAQLGRGPPPVKVLTPQPRASIDVTHSCVSSARRRRHASASTSSTLVCTDWQRFLADCAVQLLSTSRR